MRHSARLLKSESFDNLTLKLKACLSDEEIINENDDYKESEDIFEAFSNYSNSSPKKLNRGGRPKNLTLYTNSPKLIKKGKEYQEFFFDDKKNLDLNSSVELVQRDRKLIKSPKKTNVKKKLNRAGRYLPSLEHHEIKGNLLSSKEEWIIYINNENADIKRKNRKFKTNLILENSIDSGVKVKYQNFSSYIITAQTLIDDTSISEPLKFDYDESIFSLSDNSSYTIKKMAIFNAGVSVFSIHFCRCCNCSESTDFGGKLLIFVASKNKILLISAEIDKKVGIKSLNFFGKIVTQCPEMFTSISVSNFTLSITTESSHFFLNCQDLHTCIPNFQCVLDSKSRLIPLKSGNISCQSWKGKNLVVGTLLGRIHVFDIDMQEIFQTSLASKSAIYSIDWCDEFSFIVGGNFSKIFSIDLRDPFIIETEVSTLASLPFTVWSDTLQSIMFVDGENHARKLEKSTDINNRLHQPIGTYDTMVHAISVSPSHNIIATACASGAIHLSWLPTKSGLGVEFEKKIFSIEEASDNERIAINNNPEYIQFQALDTIKLYPSNQACTAVTWCPHKQFPGLLAGGYRNGMLVLLATDRFFI